MSLKLINFPKDKNIIASLKEFLNLPAANDIYFRTEEYPISFTVTGPDVSMFPSNLVLKQNRHLNAFTNLAVMFFKKQEI